MSEALIAHSPCSVLVAISQRGKPLYHRHQEHLSLPAGDLHEGISAGGLSLRAIDLETRHYRIEFADAAAQLTLAFDWRGTHESADSIGLHVPAGVAGLSNMHIEQMGRIAGRFDYRAQHIELAGMGPRDHSVGTRNWESMLWYDLAWVLLDDGRALGLIQAQQTGRLVQIPWLWDGTQLLPLSGMRFNKELDAEDRPQQVRVTFCDPLGRCYRLSGTRRTSLHCFLDSYVVHSGYFDFELVDDQGVMTGVGAEEYGYRLGEVH